jgi:hypothetical protein
MGQSSGVRAGRMGRLSRGTRVVTALAGSALVAALMSAPSGAAAPVGASSAGVQGVQPVVTGVPAGVPAGTEIRAEGCGAWSRFTDGRKTGFGFNDRNAYYIAQAFLTDLPGGHWRFRGTYPKARWISYQSYDHLTFSQDVLSGREIDPDQPGSRSPFAPGSGSDVGSTYKVDLINKPPAQRDPAAHNVLYGGYRSDPVYGGLIRAPQQSVIMRTYAAPDELDTLGGVPRPTISWVVDDPATNRFSSARDVCASLDLATTTYQPWNTIIEGLESINEPIVKPLLVPGAQWLQGIAPPTNPPMLAALRPSTTGYSSLYYNDKTPYLGLMPQRLFGAVLVVRFKTPTYARIEDGATMNGNEQVKYWDWCSTQWGTPLNYTIACRRDEQFQVDEHGYATLALSLEQDRPLNPDGTPYADWLPMAGNMGMTVMRQIEPDAQAFPESPYFLPQIMLGPVALPVDVLVEQEQIKRHMKSYYPETRYCSTQQFERDRCGLHG